MRVAIDARAYSWAGIGSYTRNLLASVVKLPSAHRFIALVAEHDEPARESLQALVSSLPPGKLTVLPVEGSYYSWREQTLFFRQLRRVKADLFHFTHFNRPLLFHKPYVVTIHDTTRFIFPGQVTRSLLRQVAHEYVFKSAVEHARTVICVSDFTRKELTTLPLRVPPARTAAEGVDDAFLQPIAKEARQRVRMMLGTSDPFVLFVGVWMGHKNLRRLLEAFRLVQQRIFPLRLVVTGKPRPGYINIARLASLWGLEQSVLFPEFVPHALLPALYAEARCLILPSLYEGFGLPPLEAAACGTPSVVSNVSSLPEIMGSGAEYINPEYTPGIADAIQRLVTDESHRMALVKRAWQRVQHFQWEKVAKTHLSVYERALRIGNSRF